MVTNRYLTPELIAQREQNRQRFAKENAEAAARIAASNRMADAAPDLYNALLDMVLQTGALQVDNPVLIRAKAALAKAKEQ